MIDFTANVPDGITLRPEQHDILTRISAAIDEGKKYIIINAPTGIGKSYIAKTIGVNSRARPPIVAEHFAGGGDVIGDDDDGSDGNKIHMSQDGTTILTTSKLLQDQYETIQLPTLKGKSNYICHKNGVGCDSGECVYDKDVATECEVTTGCPHWDARAEFTVSNCRVANYAVALANPLIVLPSQYLICDEASELEATLVGYGTMMVNRMSIAKLGLSVGRWPTDKSDSQIQMQFLQHVGNACKTTIKELRGQISNRKRGWVKLVDKVRELQSLSMRCDTVLANFVKCKYIVEVNEDGIKYTPLHITPYAQSMFAHADTVIIMSATIVDAPGLAKEFGITEYEYIDVPSPFPPENSPIDMPQRNTVSVNYRNKYETIPVISKYLLAIASMHENEKGIVHTHTNEIANMLRDLLGGNPRFCFREPHMSNEDLLQYHIDSPDPTILVSPSMTHGVDLKDDLGRFCVMVKAPYLPMGDLRVKSKMSDDPNWYTNQMLSTTIQAIGRTTRHHDDKSTTYILDSTLVAAMTKNKNKLPMYIRQRCKMG